MSQDFIVVGDRLVRQITAGRYGAESYLQLSEVAPDLLEHGAAKAWVMAMLRGAEPRFAKPAEASLRVVDLFCGAGGLSAGIDSAARAAGLSPEFVACADLDDAGLEVLARNLKPRMIFKRNVDSLLDYRVRVDNDTARFAYPPEILDQALADQVGKVDLVIGGPPCQGHSNLNNHTRRSDPRNSLYLTVPAMAIALGAKAVVIENVPAVLKDKGHAVDRAKSILTSEGYSVVDGILDSERFGVPQQRRRHFLVATKSTTVALQDLHTLLHIPSMSTMDAIQDLINMPERRAFDAPAELAQQNKDRIEYLFDHDLYNLPNEVRPDCHKDGHTYPSVYGRLHADKPAQTITGGFLSPGRGRFVHPTERRGLTPHEGARLQGFSDSYVFERRDGGKIGNKDYSKLIGDAVPPPLGYAIGLACIASL